MSSYARDSFGQRPLYYAVRDGRLHVGARAFTVLRELGLPRAIDPSAAALALCGAPPSNVSLFRGVGQVPPGSCVEMAGGQAELQQSPPRDAAHGTSLLEVLRAAVGRMSAGAACALSGGLDSGLVLALMSEGGAPPRAYTLATDFSDGVEMRSAHALAARWGASETIVRVEEERLPDHVVATVLACETPIWNGLAVARHLFFRQVRAQGETALLSGVGADELLCGNPSALQAWPAHRRAERELAESLLTGEARQALARPAAEPADLESLRRSFIEIVLPDSTLPPECRTSAVEGIEARLPYLDPAFAAVALRLPASACTRDGMGKWPLREAARGLVPEEIRAAPKTARLAPSGGGSARARRRWLDSYSAWLTPERLAPLECVDTRQAGALLDRFAAAGPPDSGSAIQDAVLLRLSSLAILTGVT